MRGKWWSVVLLAAVCLTGCGVRAEQEDRAEQTEPTAAVIDMTSEQQELAVLKENYEKHYIPNVLLTEHCIYQDVEEDDEESISILQMDHAGNELSRTSMKDPETFDQLLCASDQRIIYCSDTSSDEDEESIDLYSVPIVQTDQGETLQMEQEEKIATLSESEYDVDIYLQEPYLVYSSDEKHVLTRRDMETGEEKTLNLKGTMRFDDDRYPDGCLYPVDTDSGILYRLPVDTWTPEKLYECKSSEERIGSIWMDGQFVYMEIGRDEDGWVSDRLECLDMEQKKIVGQLSVEDTIQFMKQEKICADAVVNMDVGYAGLSVYEGKVYFTVWVSDEELDDECNNGGRLVSLCCSEKTLSDLAKEQEMTDWYYEHRNFNSIEIQDGYKDFYYIEYREKEEDDDSFMCYHLDSGKLEEVGDDELICLLDRLCD